MFRARSDSGLPFSAAVQAGDFVYASGVVATDGSGTLAGDIREQTRVALKNIRDAFAAGGTRLEYAAALHVYLAHAADFPAMNEAYREVWAQDPPARTTVATGLVVPGALIEIAGVAVREGAERTAVHPPSWAPSPRPYSYGVRSGDTLFLSGLIARRGRDNVDVPGDVAEQTRTVLANADEILEAGGMTRADVVAARVYLRDGADFAAMNEAYRPFFPGPPPARATVVAGLMNPEHRVEMTMTALKDARRRAITTPRAGGGEGAANPNLSPAVAAGGRLYVSGLLGTGETTAGDARAQARETLARLARTLAAAGLGVTDVVDAIVYLADAGDFAALNEAWREVFQRDLPARATVLVGLLAPGARVEIMAVASR
jgi:enamine deaminase RidA (YjgF/YER057c/UK114 family)